MSEASSLTASHSHLKESSLSGTIPEVGQAVRVLLDEDWTTPRLVITPDGHMLDRCEGEAWFKAFLGALERPHREHSRGCPGRRTRQ
jgi:hypothetical protein